MMLDWDPSGAPENVNKVVPISIDVTGKDTNGEMKAVLSSAKRQFRLVCLADRRVCGGYNLFFISFLRYAEYTTTISLALEADVEEIGEVELVYEHISTAFSNFEVVFKVLFFVVMLIAVVYFLYLVTAHAREWSYEQKCVIWLGQAMLLYNSCVRVWGCG